MRILFMGTPDFAVPALETLLASEHEVVGVVTQPDKPKGRGNVMMFTPVKEVALAHNIPVYQPVRVRRDEGFYDEMKALAPDIAVVIAFGQILPQSILDIPRYGCVNIHASLLPKLRGAAPIQWAVINGETESGITTMQMDAGLDTGDMLLKVVTPLAENETGGSLFERLAHMGGPLLLETLKGLESGTLKPKPQDHSAHTYAPMLSKEMGNIDWAKSAVEIERLIRGLNPWPSAYTHLGDRTLKIWEARVVDVVPRVDEAMAGKHSDSGASHAQAAEGFRDEDGNKVDILPGTVIEIRKTEGFVVACGEQALLIKTLQLQGKNRMDAPAFLRGVQLTVGTRLSCQ